MHRLLEVDTIKNLDAVAFLHKRIAYLENRGSLRVSENIRGMHLQ